MRKLLLLSFATLVIFASSCSQQNQIEKYKFEVVVEGEGKVEGTESGEYTKGTTINLISVEDKESGYIFDGFYRNDILMEVENNYTFELNDDTTIVANFIKDETKEIETNATYSHEFKDGEFSSKGGKTDTINGISWKYDSMNFCGFQSDRGVQIGSSSKPQTSTWTISTDLPEGVYVTGYDVYLCNASSGSGSYQIFFGNYSKSSNFQEYEPTSFSEVNLSEKSNRFSLSLTSESKALYLKSIEISFYVPEDVDFDVTTDGGSNPGIETPTDRPKPNYTPITVNEYYKNIDFNQSSAELFDDLNKRMTSQFTGISYGDAREILCYTDQVVGDSNHLYSLLDGDLLDAEWDQGATRNREHVWPKSLLGVSDVNNRDVNIATDLMNLRAACTNANSSHGNRYYGEKGEANAFYPNVTSGLSGTHSYSGDHRGDVARICFYMALKYDGTISLSYNPSGSYQNGYLSTLIKWDKEDPVDAFEIQRNNRIYEYQGNRNPFVDFYDKGLAELFF